jgi:hypothetical protein
MLEEYILILIPNEENNLFFPLERKSLLDSTSRAFLSLPAYKMR